MSSRHQWQLWGKRFRTHIREQGKSLGSVARDMGKAESTLRSWTNGTREINLSEYFQLCEVAELDPDHVLLGNIGMTQEQRQKLGDLVVQVLEADPAGNQAYGPVISKLKRDLAKRNTKT